MVDEEELVVMQKIWSTLLYACIASLHKYIWIIYRNEKSEQKSFWLSITDNFGWYIIFW